jgi:acetyl-CoA carboxylase biotin carboxyl carrier protein
MSANVAAPITGRVFRIEVAVGATVEAGAELVVLESMKMEIPVESPRAGRVVEIRISEGDAVEEGDVLAVID